MINSTTNSRTSPVTAPPVSFAHNEYVIVLIPNSMKGKKSVKSTGTIIKTDITTKPKIMTVDFSKPVVLNTSKYSSIENSNDIVFIKPETVKIDVKEHESKKIFNVSTTRIVIIRFPFCSPEEEKSIKRKKTADMVLDLSSYTTNDSDDGNCGTEIKHDIEPEF